MSSSSSSSSNPATVQGWVRLLDHSTGRYYYANENTRQTQWEPPEGWVAAAQLPPPPPLAEHRQQQQRHPILRHLVYRFGSGNGVDPEKFYPRAVAADILEELPMAFEDVKNDDSVSRVLLHGPPASGKTSIIGVIDKELRQRYKGKSVFVVRCFENKARWGEIHNALLEIDECVVILDDAQEWYELREFFGLFKGTNRILVAAATYSVQQLNRETPVEIQEVFSAALRPTELAPILLDHVKIDVQYHEQVKEWFGDNYGRIHLLVPQLFERLRELQSKDPRVSLSDAFFRGETLQQLCSTRLMPSLDEDMRAILTKVWNGKTDAADTQKLARYGVFREDGNWSCEFVRRKYFSELFHVGDRDWTAFHDNSIPSALEMVVKGFQEINWSTLKQSADSSLSGFPIEDIWQTHFYAGIGHFIPKELTFCKEQVAGTQNRVDFVLRNGKTIAIEFLIRSSKVDEHHERFETGAYQKLGLDEYFVVDILPWDQEPDLLDVSNERRISFATECFNRLDESRRPVHAVFLAANMLNAGILYTYDLGAVEIARSPPPEIHPGGS